MGIKMIVVDLDGTLLNEDNSISRENINALRAAHESGITVVPCTGRVLGEAMFVCEALGICRYIATCNGSLIYDLKEKKFVTQVALSLDTVMKIIHIVEQNKVFYQIYGVNDSFCSKQSMQIIQESGMIQSYIDTYKDSQVIFDDFAQYSTEHGVVALKLFISSKNVPVIQQIRKELASLDGIRTTSSLPHNIEVLPDGVDKFLAMRDFGAQIGIAPDEIMALGDSENDLNLIKHCAIGVAMGNAIPEVKRTADFVAPSNNENGVAVAVNHFILRQPQLI